MNTIDRREKMTKKKILIIAAGLLINVAVGFYNLGSSMNDKLSVVLSCIVFLLWMGFFLWLVRDKNFSMESFCKVSIVLAACFISGILLGQSLIGLMFIWPFMGIANCFANALDFWITILIMYLIPVLLSLAAALRNSRRN